LLPCVIKLGAAALLWLAPIDGASARRPTLAQRGEIG
jgi:hypothetical protein